MRRIWSLAAAGLLAAGALAACGESTRPAAVVNGLEISQQDVVDELEAIRGNANYVAAYDASAAQAGQPTVAGSTDDTFNTAFVTSTLSTRILYGIVHVEVGRRGIEIDEECRARAAEQAAQRMAPASPEGDGEAVLDAFGEKYKAYLIDREADLLALQADLADQECVDPDAAETYFEAHRDEFETACASHILVDTEEEADDLAAQLTGGADFAALAQERSIDTQSGRQGGELGCNPRNTFVPEFEEAVFSAPIGEVTGPVATQFGYHLILVAERGVGEFEDVAGQVANVLASKVDEAFQAWFTQAVAEAEVVVDERYGTWSPTTASITPIAVPDPTTTVPAGGAPSDTSGG